MGKWICKHEGDEKQRGAHAYHVLHADAAHGACLDALKSGTKLVALLLYHQPSLRNGHPLARAMHLVRRKIFTFMELTMDTNPKG